MRHSELVGINLNDPPDLHQAEAIGFDFAVGWSTSHANIDHGTDWFETVAQLVIIAAVAWVSAGTLGPAVAGSMGMSTAAAGATVTAATLTTSGLIVSAAVVGAATSLASGLLNDNLSLKGVLRGALAGALTAGLMQGVNTAFGVTASNPFSTLGGIAARTTVQGAVQALMGGKFADGALAGLASGLAEAASANMLGGINEAVANGSMSAGSAVAARTFARVIGSAVRAAASPGDPGQAFASAFLDDVFKQIDTSTPVMKTAFDDVGFLNPGIVDANASPEQQAQQLAEQLQRQGIPAAQANLMALQALGNIAVGVAQLPPATAVPEVLSLNLPPDPLIVQGRLVPNAEHDRLIAELNAEFDIDADAPPAQMDDGPSPSERDPGFMPVGWVNDVGASAAAYAQRLAGRVGGELGDLFQRAVRVAGTALSYGDIAPLESVKLDLRNYLDARSAAGGLSEAEIILFGVLYAANETLFPTNAIDFAGGIGKGIKAAGAVMVAGRGADVLATTARAINVDQAVALQVQAVEQAAKARGMEVVREVPGAKGAWNDGLNASLKPGAVYLLDNGHAYMTDALGRVTKAEGVLDLKRLDPNAYQQLMAGKLGGEGYDGGHLIAKLFGGAGEKINLIPQLSSVNRGELRVLEKEWADAIRAGKEVKVEVRPVYVGTSKVPDEVVVDHWLNGIRQPPRAFPNKPGG
jgi:DNA/RNA non-specific endonuclease